MSLATDLPPPPSLQSLRESEDIAVFLDFDGTLVAIADTPDGILVPRDLAGKLAELSDAFDQALALVSGRAIVDLESYLGPLSVARAGSHGADRMLADGRNLGDLPEALPAEVERELETFALATGLRLEEKPHGRALHYRQNPEAEEAAMAFMVDLAKRHQLVVKRGKYVIELVHPGADKGGAVRAFMEVEPFAGRRPVFVGDDVTDEDGMIAANELGGFGVLVGDRSPSCARYRLDDPAAVHEWLGL